MMMTQYDGGGSSGTINIPDPSSMVGTFAKAVIQADLEGILLKVALVLSSLFLLIWMLKQVYAMVLEEKPLNKADIIRVAALIGVLVLYSPLMHDVLDRYMAMATSEISDLIPDPGDRREELKSGLEESVSRMEKEMVDVGESVKRGMMSLFVGILKSIDDAISYLFELYVMLSLFFVRVFGPLAIVFTIFPGFGGTFMTWLKLYIKFNLYTIVVSTGIVLANSFLFMFFDEATVSGSGATALQALNPMAGLWTFVEVLLAFMVFKVLYIILGFKLLDRLFGGDNKGVGSMVGGLAVAGASAAKMAVRSAAGRDGADVPAADKVMPK